MRSRRVVALVSALGAAQSVAIVTQIGALGDSVSGTMFGTGPVAVLVITLLSSVFLAVAITVTGVVVTGATEILVIGELRTIALRRLVGASASAEQARLSREMLRRAVQGMAVGTLGGYAVSMAVLAVGFARSTQLRFGDALVPSPLLVVALVAQYLVTRRAVRRGTGGVLAVRPVEALRTTADTDRAVPATLAVPPRASGATLACGIALAVVSVVASRSTPLAMLPAVVGGIVSFLGIASCAHRIVPPLLTVIGRLLPGGLAVGLARRSLAGHPARTSRAVLGIAATVTLVTTFAVGITSFERAVTDHYRGSPLAGPAHDVLAAVVGVVGVLTAFLAVAAGVSLGNAVSFGAWLRRRDTALLRVLGQPARGIRTTILVQSLLLVLTATVLGLVLGIAYGWLGAQSVFGARVPGGIVVPVVPWPVLVLTVVAAGTLTLVAAILPIRAALRLPPIRAYLAA